MERSEVRCRLERGGRGLTDVLVSVRGLLTRAGGWRTRRSQLRHLRHPIPLQDPQDRLTSLACRLSGTTFTLSRLLFPGHQLGLCYAVKQMTGGMRIVFGVIHPWCRPLYSNTRKGEARGILEFVGRNSNEKSMLEYTFLSHLKKEIHHQSGKWNTKGKMNEGRFGPGKFSFIY